MGIARFLGVAFLVHGCVLEPIDLRGYPCPCTEGYLCEAASNRCVPIDEGDGVVLVRSLSADWTTPNWIHWTWEPETRDEHRLARYELYVAESAEDLLDRTGTTRRFDPDTNPELALYALLRSGGAEVIDATFSSGHEPDREYFGRLLAIDTAGRSRWSNVAQARTALAPVTERVIADEEVDPPGYESPPEPCYRRVVGDGAFDDGEVYYVREHVCTTDNAHECEPSNGEPSCWVDMITQEMEVPLGAFSRGDFNQAFIELSLSLEASKPSFGSHVGVQFRVDGRLLISVFDEMTFSSTEGYVVYQVRLDQMRISDPLLGAPRFLEHGDIESAELDGFRVGGSFDDGARIRLDAIALRW